jgi:hypothetical protein
MFKKLRESMSALVSTSDSSTDKKNDSLPNQSPENSPPGQPQEDKSAPMRKARSAVDERMRSLFE